jgi:serine/threonine protein kinase
VTRYELLDRIGVGGMAEIFRGKAVAAGGFEKPVAIKRILPHLSADARFVELLIAEAKVLSLLKHRNIVQIFDVGLGDDGKYFLVMEYVDGKDLGAVQRGQEVRRRRMPFDLALHVCAEICEALEHAHTARAPDGKSMSLIHRDVSPSNVLLSRAGEVKLTDFGIAKRAEQEVTGHGAVRGKFAYISPEQARNEHLDPRSDVFAVGILLWELVTNRRLFSGLGDLDALRAVRSPQVPRPRELDSRLTPEIDALIMATLSPKPGGRPTAGQLSAALRTLRYSLDVTVGDPATELAKIIDTAEEVERQSSQSLHSLQGVQGANPGASGPHEYEGAEATVIRIHTADVFSMRDKDGFGMARAREVIDRFDEEETRQALLSPDQLQFLRANAPRDSGELTSAAEPLLVASSRAQRPTDEPTRARHPLSSDDLPTIPPDEIPANHHFEDAEQTELLSRAHRRPDHLAPDLPARVSRQTNEPPMMPAPPVVRSSGTPGPASPTTAHPTPPAMQSMQPPPSQPLPPPIPLPPMPPPPMQQQPQKLPPPPQVNYPYPTQLGAGAAPAGYPRPMVPRPSTQTPRPRRKRSALRPWMLVIGALIMAGLAFAVTRAFIHNATSKPAETK